MQLDKETAEERLGNLAEIIKRASAETGMLIKKKRFMGKAWFDA